MASAEFLTSKDPQSVGAPDSSKSILICDANVVLPAPEGPVSNVSSPGRAPFTNPVSFGNDGNGAPTYKSGCLNSCRTWPRSSLKDTRPSWSGAPASSNALLTNEGSFRRQSFASFRSSGARTITQRCLPNFAENFRAAFTPACVSYASMACGGPQVSGRLVGAAAAGTDGSR